MNNWDKRFMDMAELVSTWSKDRRKKVGAVIVGEDKRIISTGYNGIAEKCNDNDDSRHIKPKKNCFFVHAEANAIYSCAKNGISVKNCTIYNTWYPCCNCCMAIIQSGITKVICYEPDWNDDSWGESFKYTKEMFEEAGIEVKYINASN